MSDVDRLELFEVAEDALLKLERAHLSDARDGDDPKDWTCALTLSDMRTTITSIRRKLGAVMVTAGVADQVPTPAALVAEHKPKSERQRADGWTGGGV